MQSSVQLPGSRVEPFSWDSVARGRGEGWRFIARLICKAVRTGGLPVSAEASRDPLRALVGKGSLLPEMNVLVGPFSAQKTNDRVAEFAEFRRRPELPPGIFT